jgi:surface protein
MKNLYALLIFTLITSFAYAQDSFITTWQTDSDSSLIIVPVVENAGNNYTIDFGDGTVSTNMTGQAIHTYSTAGTYTITMTGVYKRINFSLTGSEITYKLKTIEQWGTNPWETMENAFRGCENLILNATDTPNLSQVTNMSYMFAGAVSFNQDINNWDVSNVENMEGLFTGTLAFNQPLNDWDVSGVTNMTGLFNYAASFNQPLDNWDLSNVESIKEMFMGASAYNQPLENWDISNITDITGIFWGATAFNQPLNNWDVSGLTDMSNMFLEATSFNQPLDSWDVSNVTNMYQMFYVAGSFDQNLTSWTFNTEVNLFSFLSNSGMGVTNYDLLLARFLQLGLQDKDFGADGLHFCNWDIHNTLDNTMGWFMIGDNPAADCGYNTIYGKVHFDAGNDGCDDADITTDLFLVNANNGNPFYSGSPVEGYYELTVIEENTYTVSLLNVPSYFSVSTENPEVTFSGFGAYQEINFCLTASEAVEDLNITLLPTNEARPGFIAYYQLVIENIGSQTVSGASVSLAFDNVAQNFISADQAPVSSTTGMLSFDIASIQPFERKFINVVMQTLPPPAVNGDDVLNFTATVTGDTDITPADNTFELAQTVVNAFDPNDKQVLQGSEITPAQADGYLDYIIRFQNTGTASAIKVSIIDDLDEKLDWNTLKPLSASHPYKVIVTNGNHVEFLFEDINLPYEAADEPGSHGFAAFKIKPVETAGIGDIITGFASIYFDFNEPIVTNTVATEIVDTAAGIHQQARTGLVAIYPNPATDILYIQAAQNVVTEAVSIFNLQGRKLMTVSENTGTINIGGLSAGVYIVAIKTKEGIVNQRLIKK